MIRRLARLLGLTSASDQPAEVLDEMCDEYVARWLAAHDDATRNRIAAEFFSDAETVGFGRCAASVALGVFGDSATLGFASGRVVDWEDHA